MVAPLVLQKPQQRYIGPSEVTPRNQTLRKVALFSALLGLGLTFAHLWVGVGVTAVSLLAFRYLTRIDLRLSEAVFANNDSRVKFFLRLGGNPNSGDLSMLYQAAHRGNKSMIRNLLAAGANPNLIDKSGQFPLLGAVAHHQVAATRLLLARGASRTTQWLDRSLLDLARAHRTSILENQPLPRSRGDTRTPEQQVAAVDRIVEMLSSPA